MHAQAMGHINGERLKISLLGSTLRTELELDEPYGPDLVRRNLDYH